MLENRRHFRLRELISVAWKLEDQEISGEGTVVNISSSGLQLRTDQVFKPSDDCVISVGSETGNLPFSSKKGRIVWFRRIQAPQDCFLCGVKFVEGKTDSGFQEWLNMKVSRLSEASNANILGNMVS